MSTMGNASEPPSVPLAAFEITVQVSRLLMYLLPAVSFAYAIYFTSYVTCLWVLLRNRKEGHVWHLVSSTILFLLVTTGVVLQLALSILLHVILTGTLDGSLSRSQLETMNFAFKQLGPASEFVSIFIFWMADIILIYRCYVIWNRKKLILVLPGLLFLASIILQIPATVFDYLLTVSPIQNVDPNELTVLGRWPRPPAPLFPFVMTVVVTALSVWRIWAINYRARKVFGNNMRDSYRRAISLLLESGFIYSFLLLIDTILTSVYNAQQRNSQYSTENLLSGTFTSGDVLFGLAMVFSGLLPTMMLVYVGLELGVKSEEITGSSAQQSFATSQMKGRVDVERGSNDEPQQFSSQFRQPDRDDIRPQRIQKF